MICPDCGTENNAYQSFSAGREMYCFDHDDTFLIDDADGELPRAILLRTETGRTALRAEMGQYLAAYRNNPQT